MDKLFSEAFPSWLIEPQLLKNVMDNQFSSLQNISTAVSVPDMPRFLTGLKQALYWRRQLASSASKFTVIFSFLGVRGLAPPNVLEVCTALKSICNMTQLVEVYRAPNSPFIGMSFSDSTPVNIFQTLCHSFNDFFVFTVSPLSAFTHNFKLLGLPPLFNDSHIHHFLAKHSVQHNFTRDHITTDVHTTTPLNSVSGTIQLSPTQDISLIPHLIPLPPPHLGSALFIISGRQSLCLKCGDIGHIRRFCTASKCQTCHHFHMSTSPCSAQSFLDSSVIRSWDIEDSLTTLSSTDSSTIPSALPECPLTCELPSPASSSSPAISTTYADVLSLTSSSIINSDSSSLKNNLTSILQDNITMPSNLSSVIVSNQPSLVTNNVKLTSSQSVSPSSLDLSSAGHHPSIAIDSISTVNSHHQSSKAKAFQSTSSASIIAQSSSTYDEAYKAVKRAKKDSFSAKKILSSSEHNLSHPNIFNELEDEVKVSIADSLFHASADNMPSFTSSQPSTKSTDLPFQSSGSFSHHTSENLSIDASIAPALSSRTTATHKRRKKTSISQSTLSSFPSQLTALSPTASIPSWGERMEMDTNPTISTQDDSRSTALSDLTSFFDFQNSHLKMPVSSASLISSVTEPNSLTLLTPSLISSELEAVDTMDLAPEGDSSDSDASSSSSQVIVYISGFPGNESFDTILNFLGLPIPVDIRFEGSVIESAPGHHLVVYASYDDAQNALSKDGTWHNSSIISVATKEDYRDSEDSS